MQSNILYVEHEFKCETKEVRRNLELIPVSIVMSFTLAYQESRNYVSFKLTF